jgi:choline kinase
LDSEEYKKSDDRNILIIPAAGRSSRFGDMKPKWMLTHPKGNLMIQEVVGALDLNGFDEAHIVILKDHCDQHDADLVLKQAFKDHHHPIRVTVLENPTSSSPETVVECILKNELNGRITVKDCDCLVRYSHEHNSDFIVSLNINNQSIKNIQNKSFIHLDANGYIENVVEKKVVSDTICLGVYSMMSEKILEYYQKLKRIEDLSEIYFSHLFSLHVMNGGVCKSLECLEFIDWGTPEEWFDYVSNLKTYLFDIDGVLLENTGKYGRLNWSNSFLPIRQNIEKLKSLSDAGSEIIFTTSRTEQYLQEFKGLLEREQINYKCIVSGCNHSKRIVVNDFAKSNPYPSCSAISVPRNSILGEYV